MTSPIQPLHKNIVVRIIEIPEIAKKASIILTTTSKSTHRYAEVVEVPEALEQPKKGQIKPGAIILLGQYSGMEIDIDGEKLLIVKYEEIIGIYRAQEGTKFDRG